MTTVTFTVHHRAEYFTHEDMGFTDEEWEALSEEDQQQAIESYCEGLFEDIQYDTEVKD